MKAFVLRRSLRSVIAAVLELSATSFALALTPDSYRQEASRGAAIGPATSGEDPTDAASEAMETSDEVRNRDRPPVDRYPDWMVGSGPRAGKTL